LFDHHHRVINYLRLSVTDRCNLRCLYCMPEQGVQFIPHGEILSYEEMLRIIALCIQQGIRKVRLTGGEPLVRKGFIGFVERLNKIRSLDEITLTTNGVLLKDFACALRDCGICRINVSMDTLKPDRFRQITGRDDFARVWEGIEEAERAGFNPIKLNVVVMRGVNDDEVLDFAHLTRKKYYRVRFIEIMPIGRENSFWTAERFMPAGEILNRIRTLGVLKPIDRDPLDGPAERFTFDGAKGEIGLIGALSLHFCESCNRLRLTADGHLRGCLFSDQETDLKTPLREGKEERYLLNLIRTTMQNKPANHGFMKLGPRKCTRQMHGIGG
jgi:cyclic pyranopterin phosphate synthase